MTLKDEILSDLDAVFFDPEEFGTVATTTGGSDIPGMLLRDYLEATPGGTVSVRSTEPIFRCATASATGVVEGTVLTVEGDTYAVVEPMPDDSGYTDFRMHLT